MTAVDMTITKEEWLEQAVCAQTDPEAFFPEKGGSTREAKSVCVTCPIVRECLQYALDHDERFGIWGGLSERERRKLKKTLTKEKKMNDLNTAPEEAPVMLPDYIVELAELLAATENHKDPLVRATRKIVVQAAIALDQAQAAAPVACRECGCTDLEACFPTCSWVEPNLCSSCAEAPKTSGSDATATAQPSQATPASTSTPEPEASTTGHLTTKQRLMMLGVDQMTVREWAADNGVEYNRQGTIRTDVLDAYEAAHNSAAA